MTPSAPADKLDRQKQDERRRQKWIRRQREFLLYGVGIALFLIFLYLITRERG